MKKAINNEGIEIEVADNVPTRNKGGVRYLQTEQEVNEYNAKRTVWENNAPARALEAVIDARNKERGSWQEQMHYLIKNGLDALQQRDNDIELRHPKP